MIRFLLIVLVLGWVVLMPPLFTDGACTREYEAASALVTSPANRTALATPAAAQSFFAAQGLAATVLTPADCARSKPRFLRQCGSGALVYADVPVSNKVCKIYRDDRTLVRLQYDRRDRLIGTYSEMSPYKFLPLPWGGSIDWAK